MAASGLLEFCCPKSATWFVCALPFIVAALLGSCFLVSGSTIGLNAGVPQVGRKERSLEWNCLVLPLTWPHSRNGISAGQGEGSVGQARQSMCFV